MPRFFNTLLKLPLLHFLLLGLLLLFLIAEPAAKPRIIIDDARLAALRDSWSLSRGSLPSIGEQKMLLALEIEDQVLMQEALRQGFNQLPVVQRRMQQLASFLSVENSDAADSKARYKQAQALGLEQSDPLIRQYMISAMRERLAAQLSLTAPSEQDLQRYYTEHAQAYYLPARRRFSHAYIGGLQAADKTRAIQLLAQTKTMTVAEVVAAGEPFYGGHHLPSLTVSQLQKKFGGDFSENLLALIEGQWSDPIASSYGYHLLWLVGSQPGEQPPLAQVQAGLSLQLKRQWHKQALDDAIAALIAGYEIERPALR